MAETTRRKMGYWDPFNNWWRDFVAEHNKRPKVNDMKRWYDANADSVWTGAPPTWEETKRHSKGMRRKEEISSYFREYRRVRKRKAGASATDSESSESEDQADAPGARRQRRQATAAVADTKPLQPSQTPITQHAEPSSSPHAHQAEAPSAPTAPQVEMKSTYLPHGFLGLSLPSMSLPLHNWFSGSLSRRGPQNPPSTALHVSSLPDIPGSTQTPALPHQPTSAPFPSNNATATNAGATAFQSSDSPPNPFRCARILSLQREEPEIPVTAFHSQPISFKGYDNEAGGVLQSQVAAGDSAAAASTPMYGSYMATLMGEDHGGASNANGGSALQQNAVAGNRTANTDTAAPALGGIGGSASVRVAPTDLQQDGWSIFGIPLITRGSTLRRLRSLFNRWSSGQEAGTVRAVIGTEGGADGTAVSGEGGSGPQEVGSGLSWWGSGLSNHSQGSSGNNNVAPLRRGWSLGPRWSSGDQQLLGSNSGLLQRSLEAVTRPLWSMMSLGGPTRRDTAIAAAAAIAAVGQIPEDDYTAADVREGMYSNQLPSATYDSSFAAVPGAAPQGGMGMPPNQGGGSGVAAVPGAVIGYDSSFPYAPRDVNEGLLPAPPQQLRPHPVHLAGSSNPALTQVQGQGVDNAGAAQLPQPEMQQHAQYHSHFHPQQHPQCQEYGDAPAHQAAQQVFPKGEQNPHPQQHTVHPMPNPTDIRMKANSDSGMYGGAMGQERQAPLGPIMAQLGAPSLLSPQHYSPSAGMPSAPVSIIPDVPLVEDVGSNSACQRLGFVVTTGGPSAVVDLAAGRPARLTHAPPIGMRGRLPAHAMPQLSPEVETEIPSSHKTQVYHQQQYLQEQQQIQQDLQQQQQLQHQQQLQQQFQQQQFQQQQFQQQQFQQQQFQQQQFQQQQFQQQQLQRQQQQVQQQQIQQQQLQQNVMQQQQQQSPTEYPNYVREAYNQAPYGENEPYRPPQHAQVDSSMPQGYALGYQRPAPQLQPHSQRPMPYPHQVIPPAGAGQPAHSMQVPPLPHSRLPSGAAHMGPPGHQPNGVMYTHDPAPGLQPYPAQQQQPMGEQQQPMGGQPIDQGAGNAAGGMGGGGFLLRISNSFTDYIRQRSWRGGR